MMESVELAVYPHGRVHERSKKKVEEKQDSYLEDFRKGIQKEIDHLRMMEMRFKQLFLNESSET